MNRVKCLLSIHCLYCSILHFQVMFGGFSSLSNKQKTTQLRVFQSILDISKKARLFLKRKKNWIRAMFVAILSCHANCERWPTVLLACNSNHWIQANFSQDDMNGLFDKSIARFPISTNPLMLESNKLTHKLISLTI